MNKGILIAIAAVFLIGGGIGFAMMNRPTVTDQTTPLTETTSDTDALVETGSIRSLLAINGSHTCTFTDTTSGSTGTMYINNGSMRGDFNSMINGTNTASHMITTDNTFYVWMDTSSSGFKFSLDQLEKFKNNSNAPKTVDIDQQVQYECRPWSTDMSILTVPTSVEFTDMSAMMESVPSMMIGTPGTNNQGTTPGASEQCAACDSLSGDYKTQCLQALKCN